MTQASSFCIHLFFYSCLPLPGYIFSVTTIIFKDNLWYTIDDLMVQSYLDSDNSRTISNQIWLKLENII
uniref:Uncharacterized protein n=1 Tax=Tetranychus urticae TaxID=32264 RepID=T1K9N8_TETUR